MHFKTYIQRSRLFLYPILEIPFDSLIKPVMTYLATDKDNIGEVQSIILKYKQENTEEYYKFRNDLLEHPRFDKHKVLIKYDIITFNLSDYKDDIQFLIQGKYSMFSEELKRKIKMFYNEKELGASIIDSYLYPEKYHKYYADYYSVSVDVMKEAHETFGPPLMSKEIIKLN
jgi:hypothetical protein